MHWGSPPLLTDEEKEILRSKKGNLPTLLLQTWALRAAREGYKRCGVEAPIYGQLQSTVLELRRCCASITNQLALPIPFPYYHALVMLMMINFALYCVAFLVLESWATPLAMFLICLVTTGVREVSCALANPFGTDEVDFPVQKYIADMRALVSALCNQIEWQPTLHELLTSGEPPAWAPPPPPPPPPPHDETVEQRMLEAQQYGAQMAYEQMAHEQQEAYEQQRYEQQYPSTRWGRHEGACVQKYESVVPAGSNGRAGSLPPIHRGAMPRYGGQSMNSYFVKSNA